MDYCYTEKPRVRKGDLYTLPSSETSKLASAAKAFSDPVRIQMIYLLGQRPDLCTCEFEELLGLSQSKISYHLNILLDAGVINRETHGTWSHYSLLKTTALNHFKALV